VKPPGMDPPACLENKTPELSRRYLGIQSQTAKATAPAIAPYLRPVGKPSDNNPGRRECHTLKPEDNTL